MGKHRRRPIARQGLLADHGPLPNLNKLSFSLGRRGSAGLQHAYAICINTTLVPPGQEPKSWMDLTDPKWKGKILSDEMTQAGGGQTWFAVMLEKIRPRLP